MLTLNSHVAILTITRHWPAGEAVTDRRRHRRFDISAVAGRVAIIGTANRTLEFGSCALLNISYGGMCAATDWPVHVCEEYHFLLELGPPLCDIALVKARVVWVEPDDNGHKRFGARFIESSKGWLGPDEDGDEAA